MVLDTAFEKVLRRVLRRCLAVAFGGNNGQRTEQVKTGQVNLDHFTGHFRGHFRAHVRGTSRGSFRVSP